jgi:hypothetical protein
MAHSPYHPEAAASSNVIDLAAHRAARAPRDDPKPPTPAAASHAAIIDFDAHRNRADRLLAQVAAERRAQGRIA